RERVDRELDAELRATFDLLIDERIRAGDDPQAARRAARLELGSVDSVAEQVRAGRTGVFLDTVLQDVRGGLRLLRRNPVFALTAGVTLALCMAANTALFTIVHPVLLEPLAIPHSDRGVLLYNRSPPPGLLP